MSQQKPPVPAPRKKINLPSHSMDDELLSSSSTPQSQRYSRDSSALRVLPRSLSTQNDTVYDRQQRVGNNAGLQPIPLPMRTPGNQLNTTTKTRIGNNVGLQPITLPMRTPGNQLNTTTKTRVGNNLGLQPIPLPTTTPGNQLNTTTKTRVGNNLGLQPPPLPTTTPGNQLNTTTKTRVGKNVGLQPPPLPTTTLGNQLNTTTKTRDDSSVAYQEMTPWTDVSRDLQLKGLSETQVITSKAKHLYKAIQRYIKLMSTKGVQLEGLNSDLKSIAGNLNKVSKGTKIAGITGGASSAAGGVAAAAGVILAPFTAGASLALTVVGAGVVAAGGVTGASAAIAHKANLNQDTKKINKLLQEFKEEYEEILKCLRFINEGMDQLRHHGLSILKEKLDNNMIQSRNAASAVQLAIGEDSATVPERSANASGVLDGFALGMDIYFTKDGQEVKKGLESKLAKKLLKLAEQFDLGLTELKKMKDVFS